MNRMHDDRGAFRCSVSSDNASAKLKIGRKFHDVVVQDVSRKGFTVRVSDKLAKKLKEDTTYQLQFAGEHWEVFKESSYSDSLRETSVGFSRGRDLTDLKMPSSPIWSYAPQVASQADPGFIFFLMLAFLIGCISLPGVGDGLGTAPKVRKGIHIIMDVVKETIQ